MIAKEKKSVTTFKISSALNQKLDEKIIADGYGMRGKSKWLREAIEQLFTYPNYPELVSLTDDCEIADHAIVIRAPEKLFFDIEQAIIPIRKIQPDIEGVKSKVVRTAILQRLIRWNY